MGEVLVRAEVECCADAQAALEGRPEGLLEGLLVVVVGDPGIAEVEVAAAGLGFRPGDPERSGSVVAGSALWHVETTTRFVNRPARAAAISDEKTTAWLQSPESSRKPL